jgi:alpha-glucoside transport system substrate-binding protein
MTKPLAAWLALATVIAVAAGCGGGGGSDKGLAAQAQNVSGSVSVTGIWVGEEQKSFQAVIDDFKSRFPQSRWRGLAQSTGVSESTAK